MQKQLLIAAMLACAAAHAGQPRTLWWNESGSGVNVVSPPCADGFVEVDYKQARYGRDGRIEVCPKGSTRRNCSVDDETAAFVSLDERIRQENPAWSLRGWAISGPHGFVFYQVNDGKTPAACRLEGRE